ncbi:hypothetical protein HD806DRAFT_519046 [Xylariaceae sp. AK1471]|nr:hypothetical protein HD806DRAFT_519046 [Xylariaceae sp. AK1471]
MDAKRSVDDDDKPRNMKETPHSDTGDISELSISFQPDLELDYISMNINSDQSFDNISSYSLSLSPVVTSSSSSSSSDLQSEYVMISCPNRGVLNNHLPTDTHSPDASTSSLDKKERATRSPPALSLCPFPPSNHDERAQRSSSSQLRPPQESAQSEPEPTTPRTRRFQKDMLSALSLLPPDRYVSPAPSVSEGEFEEMETE